MLSDGAYDVIVVDATAAPGPGGGISLEVAILAGPHKGEVVGVQAIGLPLDEVDALGTPGTLTVKDGQPSVTLEP